MQPVVNTRPGLVLYSLLFMYVCMYVCMFCVCVCGISIMVNIGHSPRVSRLPNSTSRPGISRKKRQEKQKQKQCLQPLRLIVTRLFQKITSKSTITGDAGQSNTVLLAAETYYGVSSFESADSLICITHFIRPSVSFSEARAASILPSP